MAPPIGRHRTPFKPKPKPKSKTKSEMRAQNVARAVWSSDVIGPRGVVTGCDSNHEWMLRWWFEKYSKHNDYPVRFADFGMSSDAVDWCRQRGTVIPLTFNCRRRMNWFKKPLAVLSCPFKRIFWIDLDCEIRGSIDPMFGYIEEGIAVTLDPHNPWVKTKPVVASGVVGTKHNHPLILKWGKQCMTDVHMRGDQEVLNQIIHARRDELAIMPPEYQWLRIDGDKPDALIMHWTGARGKDIIRGQVGLPPLMGHRYHYSIRGERPQRGHEGIIRRKRGVTSLMTSRISRARRSSKIQRNISPHKRKRAD